MLGIQTISSAGRWVADSRVGRVLNSRFSRRLGTFGAGAGAGYGGRYVMHNPKTTRYFLGHNQATRTYGTVREHVQSYMHNHFPSGHTQHAGRIVRGAHRGARHAAKLVKGAHEHASMWSDAGHWLATSWVGEFFHGIAQYIPFMH